MKKDTIRDYATDAFRYYAACGCRTSDEIKEQIYQRIFEQSKKDYATITKNKSYSSSVEYAIISAERAVERHKAEILDILAVEMTLKELESGDLYSIDGYNRHDTRFIKRAIQIVYFTEPDKEIKKNDISNRVHKAEITIPASERQIYYWLKKARHMFAEHRGLRIS